MYTNTESVVRTHARALAASGMRYVTPTLSSKQLANTCRNNSSYSTRYILYNVTTLIATALREAQQPLRSALLRNKLLKPEFMKSWLLSRADLSQKISKTSINLKTAETRNFGKKDAYF